MLIIILFFQVFLHTLCHSTHRVVNNKNTQIYIFATNDILESFMDVSQSNAVFHVPTVLTYTNCNVSWHLPDQISQSSNQRDSRTAPPVLWCAVLSVEGQRWNQRLRQVLEVAASSFLFFSHGHDSWRLAELFQSSVENDLKFRALLIGASMQNISRKELVHNSVTVYWTFLW